MIPTTTFFKVMLYLVILGSCRFMCMKPMSVTSHWPPEGIVDTDSVTSIVISFSSQANKAIVEKAFSVNTDGKKAAGRISWPSDRILEFKPDIPFTKTSTYSVEVSSMAEDSEGNSLAFDFQYSFRGNADEDPPRIISFGPDGGNIIDTARPTISFVFSEAMNESSVIDAFTCSPSARGYLLPSIDGISFTYALDEDLRWGVPYTFTITTKALDLAGNRILMDYERYLTVGSDSTSPTIVTASGSTSLVYLSQDNLDGSPLALTRGIEKDDAFLIVFSEPMDRDSLEKSGVFSPSIEYDTLWNADNTSLTFHPRVNLTQDFTYAITIPKTVRDKAGNSLETDAMYRFMVDGPNSKRPRVVMVEMLNEFTSDEPSGMTRLDHFQTITLSDSYSNRERIGFFDLYIETSSATSLDNLSIAHSIRISAENARITPIGYQVDDDVRFHADVTPPTISVNTSDTLHLIRYIALIDNSGNYEDTPGFITITVGPDLSDTLSNSPLTTWKMRIITAN